MTDAGENGAKRETTFIKALRLVSKTDWKSLFMVLCAVGGLAGAVWNKVEHLYHADESEDVQAGSYELVAGRIEELFVKFDSLERRVALCEAGAKSFPAVPPTPVTAPRPPAPAELAGPAMFLHLIPEVEEDPEFETEIRAMEIEAKYEKARLPPFEMLQQKREQDEETLDLFLEQAK